jgi:hypothetical protein
MSLEPLFDIDDAADFEAQLNIDDEDIFHSSKLLAPEKRLSSPITDGLTRRVDNITKQAWEKANLPFNDIASSSRRIAACTDFLRDNPEHNFSNIKQPLLQFSKMTEHCLTRPLIITPHVYPTLLRMGIYRLSRLHDDYDLAREIYQEEIDAYMAYVSDICKPEEIWRIRKCLEVPRGLNQDVIHHAASARLWSDVVEAYRKDFTRNFSNCKHTIGPIRIINANGFSIFKTDVTPWYLVTYEQLQMLQDAAHSRLNLYTALHLGFHNGTTKLSTFVDLLLHWQEDCLRVYGNDGYELIKSPEAVFKTRLNSLTGGDVLQYSSYDRTIDKMMVKERKLSTAPTLIPRLDNLARKVFDLNDCAELFGLIKLSGHPIVYAEKSAASVRTEALPVGTHNIYYIRQVRRMMTHLTLSGYIKKHSAWPPFICAPPIGTELRRHYNNRVTDLPLSSYNLSDNDGVLFDKFVEFDYSDDYLKFLDDKAICPGVQETSKFWFGNPNKIERRLLTKILTLPHFDARSNVERLRRRQFLPDEMIVELTQKERELKNAARCFCKLPIRIRTFFTLTEYNIGEYFMKPYLPHQTMTMSSAEVRDRLHKMTKNSKHRETALVESDLSRWNLRMRESTMAPVTSILEDVFGLPGVFSQAHWFFSHSTIVLTDKHELPEGASRDKPINEWPEGALLWRNRHLGGFEGITQKPWTIFTICMMLIVLHDKNVSFIMAGQGDNHVFALSFDTSKVSIREQLTDVLACMQVRCSYLNHDVKPEECIDSLTVLTYSKELYVNGVHILYNLKFASRTMSVSDSDVPSLSKEIAAINATAIACADSCKYTFKATMWRSLMTLWHLTTRRTSLNHEAEWQILNEIRDDRELNKFVLLLPGSLGGLPVQTWGRFFLKGEVDDLSWDVAAVLRLAPSRRALANDLQLLKSGDYSPKSPDLTQLILDPLSIPIKRPKDLSRLIKEAVQDSLPGITKNKWIYDIISTDTKSSGNRLLAELAKTTPLYPKIMSDIYSCSPAGVRDTLLGRFTMTRTIVNITNNNNFTRDIARGNVRLLQNLKSRFTNAITMRGHHPFRESAFELCTKLRSLWGPSVQHCNSGVYCPLDWALTTELSTQKTISASTRTPVSTMLTDVGPYPPNFGTKTRQKKSEHGYKVILSSGTLQDLKTLVMTASELKANAQFVNLINGLIRARSPWSLDTLSTIFPTAYGGVAPHRHDQINSSAFSVLGSKTTPTHINFCSDNAGELSGGELDYPVVFQEFYLFMTQLYSCLSVSGAIVTPLAFGLIVPTPLVGIDDEPVKLETRSGPIKWKSLSGNSLCYVNRIGFSEIPHEPPPQLIPHYLPSEVPAVTSIFNLLLSSTPINQIVSTSPSSIVLPIELIDLKEFNHCPLSDLMTAVAWYALTVALYRVVRANPKDAHVFLVDALHAVSRFVSGKISRLLVHLSNASSKFCTTNAIVLNPGKFGAINAALNCAGLLVNRAIDAMRAHELIHDRRYKCLLFKDTSARYNAITLMCGIAITASSTFDYSKLLVTSYQRKIIEIGFLHAESVRPNVSGPRIIENAVSEALSATRHSERITGQMRRWTGYLYTTAVELVRELRAQKREERVSTQPVSNGPTIRRTPRNGKVMWEGKKETFGNVMPAHVCQYGTRKIVMFCDLLQRPYGRFASAVSVWARFFSENRIIRNKPILLIGVGHGAVAHSAFLLGATSVTGIDLVESFPMITQRESTYIPDEILASGYANRFTWHQHVWRQGGNAALPGWNTDVADKIIIIDVEIDIVNLIPILNLVPHSREFVLRLQGCDKKIRWILSALETRALYCVSSLHTMTNAYIGIFRKTTAIIEGSYSDISSMHHRPIATCIDRKLSYSTVRINDLIRKFGIEVKEASLPELRHARLQIQRIMHNLTIPSLIQDATTLIGALRIIDEWMHTPTKINVHSIGLLEPGVLRIVASHLSCSLHDIDGTIDRLRESI